MAIDVLLNKGVPQERIIFINLIASPEGAARFSKTYPKVRIVTAFVDEGLNEKKYVLSVSVCTQQVANAIEQLHCSRSGRFWRPILYSVESDK